MRQEQFIDKFKHAGHTAAELDRKWRLYLEQKENDELLEMAQQQYTANNAPAGLPGGGGTYAKPASEPTDYYSLQINYEGIGPSTNLVRLSTDGSVEIILLQNYQFYGYTVFASSWDDPTHLYFISQDLDAEEMVAGLIDMESGQVGEIVRISGSIDYSPPASLWYIGENQFNYLTDNNAYSGGSQPKIVYFNTQGYPSIVGNIDYQVYTSLSFFKWNDGIIPANGDLWGIVSASNGPGAPYLAYLANDSGGIVIDSDPIILTFEGAPTGPAKPGVIFGTTVNNENEVIVNMLYEDLATTSVYPCLARLDMNTAVATFLQDIYYDNDVYSYGVATFPLTQIPTN